MTARPLNPETQAGMDRLDRMSDEILRDRGATRALMKRERQVLVDLLCTLPVIEHTCFRPQGCVDCGRSKERNFTRDLLRQGLAAINTILDESEPTR